MRSSRRGSEGSRKRSFNVSIHSAANENTTNSKGDRSIIDESHVFTANDSKLATDCTLSPESLAMKLDRYCADIVSLHKEEYCDLTDFEIEDGVENLEKLREMREEMHQKLSNFDFAGRTDVNFEGAAIAGAKVVVEERAATRSITKKLTDEVGINEENLLYSGLPYKGIESSVAKGIHEQRTDSIVESFVDFQKQLKFKLNVLSHAIKKVENVGKSKSAALPDRVLRRGNPQNGETVKSSKLLRKTICTPKKRRGVNPLAFHKIIDDYALEVASEVTNQTQIKKRNVAPIPFDLSILDDIRLSGDTSENEENKDNYNEPRTAKKRKSTLPSALKHDIPLDLSILCENSPKKNNAGVKLRNHSKKQAIRKAFR